MLKNDEDFEILNLHSLVILISFILFIISLFFLKNIILVIVIYLLLLYLSTKFNNNVVKLICCILPFIIFGYLILHFIKFNLVKKESFIVYLYIIKILLFSDYLVIIYLYFKNRNKNSIKNNKLKLKKYTFRELRKQNINKVININKKYIDKYIKNNDIDTDSDYYKVINDNLKNKSINDLEEYIWINYLRFYKNRRNNHFNIFSKYNFVFLGIHAIILILVLVVR